MPHPYISRIEIKNFRNFKFLEVDLDPTAVFLGQNKAGKSNLIEALRLIFDGSMPDAARYLRAEDFWDGLDKPFSGNVIEVKVHIRDFKGNKSAEALLCDCIVEKSPLTAAVTYQFRPSGKISVSKEETAEADYEFIIFGGSDEGRRIRSDMHRWLSLIVLPALRDAQSDLQNWRRSPLRPLLERIRKNMNVGKLEEVREQLDEAKELLLGTSQVSQLIEDINLQMKALAGSVQAVKAELDFAPSDPSGLFRSLKVFMEGRSVKPIADASLGTANMLFLALLLQDLDMRQEAGDIVSAIVAIEEPEAHLHPQLQRLLFRHFLQRPHPVLLTTHSPSIASVAPIGSLVLLREFGGESRAYTARQSGFSEVEVADMQRYLNVTRAEILFARGVVLVEGMAERFIVTAFIENYLRENHLGDSLDEFGLVVCVVDGTDFKPYWRLLSEACFSMPCVLITDGDSALGGGRLDVPGVVRATKLIQPNGVAGDVGRLLDAGDINGVRIKLEQMGLFVGEQTLELDLLPEYAPEIIETFAELRGSKTVSTKFSLAVDSAKKDPCCAKEVMERIDEIGKGRFAQRLASKISKKPAPRYVHEAIRHIVHKVQ